MAFLIASNGCMGEKIEDEVGKICHIVISDVIKTGLLAVRRDVTRERKWMAEGMDNVEGRQSCDDSSYDERTVRLPTAAMMFTVGARAGKMAVAVQTHRERSLTSLNVQEPKTTLQLRILVLLVPKTVLNLCNLHWCSFVCTHIQMSTFCSFHCVVVVVRGDFM